MKKFLALGVTATVAVALYATAAPAGQQAVTPGQFNALKVRVAKLEKRASTLENVINACFQGAMPVARFNGYVGANSDGTLFITSAVDVTDSGESPSAFLLDVGSTCANAINSTAGFHRFNLVRPATVMLKRH
jgi:hypothetical protein